MLAIRILFAASLFAETKPNEPPKITDTQKLAIYKAALIASETARQAEKAAMDRDARLAETRKSCGEKYDLNDNLDCVAKPEQKP